MSIADNPAAAVPLAPTVAGASVPTRRVVHALPATWKTWHTIASMAIVGALVLIGLAVPASAGVHAHSSIRLWSWLAILVLLGAFVAISGQGLSGLWRGALVDERNKMSLSRLQMIVWTLIVLSAFLAAALNNIAAGAANPLQIPIPNELWTLMGITTTALLGSPLILSLKRAQPADPNQARATLQRLVPGAKVDVNNGRASTTGGDSCGISHQGQVVVNSCVKDAQWSDLFRGEEIGNAANLDLGKIQMFYFTVIVALAYAVALGTLFAQSSGVISAFPALDQSTVALLAISNAGYLSNKAVPHSNGATDQVGATG
jgi:hypothetical protein